MSIEFEKITADDQITRLAQMAQDIWQEYWPPLIGTQQTNYMIKQFQSYEALTISINDNGYTYWFIKDNNTVVGYTGVHQEDDAQRLFISKVYLFAHARGKGYAKETFLFLEDYCKSQGLTSLYLTVNKHNERAIKAYTALGLTISSAVVSDIGNGFVMDDYIMEKTLNK